MTSPDRIQGSLPATQVEKESLALLQERTAVSYASEHQRSPRKRGAAYSRLATLRHQWQEPDSLPGGVKVVAGTEGPPIPPSSGFDASFILQRMSLDVPTYDRQLERFSIFYNP